MKNYSTVFFDLDGTLVDSGEGVRNSVVYALNKFGIEVENKDSLSCFIGPPLTVSFKTFFIIKAVKGLKGNRKRRTDKAA